MTAGNFTDIPGFNSPARRERPALRAAVAAALAGAMLAALWKVAPYLLAAVLVIGP